MTLTKATYSMIDGAIVNVLDYGAVGDGVSDDTAAIKAALAVGLPVKFPKGNYKITETIVLYGALNYRQTDAAELIFDDGTTITKVGTATGDSAYDAAFAIKKRAGAGECYNVRLLGRFFIEAENSDYGVVYESPSAKNFMDAAVIRAKTCIYTPQNIWLSEWGDLTLYPDLSGFEMTASGTSNVIKRAFVYGSTVHAFKLVGTYSFAYSLAADACTGVIYYGFFSEWVIGSAGCESPDCDVVARVQNGKLVFENLTVYNLNPANAALRVFNASAAGLLSVHMGSVNSRDPSVGKQTMAGKLFDLSVDARLEFGENISVLDIWQNSVSTDNPNSSMRIFAPTLADGDTKKGYSTDFLLRSGGQVITGVDTQINFGTYLDPYHVAPFMRGTAFVHNITTSPLTRVDGASLQFERGGAVGDVWLSKSPGTIRGLGWVNIAQSGPFVNDGTYMKIPYVDQGSTALRPSSQRAIGQMYFDTTLGKPIWWFGTVWVDATGATV